MKVFSGVSTIYVWLEIQDVIFHFFILLFFIYQIIFIFTEIEIQ